MQAEFDDVIPHGVFLAYQTAISPERCFHYQIAHADHFLGAWFNQYPDDFINFFNKIKKHLA